jgi:3-oxoacyl-[acyl-carrier protein] reductase
MAASSSLATPLREWDEIDVEEWDRVMAVNLRGPFLCCKAVVPAMKERNYGKIVNISSSSILVGNPRRAHYVTTKAGLIGFTRSLAVSWQIQHLREQPFAGQHGQRGCHRGLRAATVQARTEQSADSPVQRPEDLVGTLTYLASSDSDFVTGQAIVVDGGVYMY